MDDVLVFASVGGLGAVHEFHGIGGDRRVVLGEVEVLGGELVNYRVYLYDCGSDAMGDEGGRRGTDAEATSIQV